MEIDPEARSVPANTPTELPYSYVPVTHEGQPAYEVIHSSGRGTGIIRFNRQSANGAAQTLNNSARRLIKRRARVEARNS